MNTAAIIDVLRDEVPPEIEKYAPAVWSREENGGRGRCIQHTRVGIEALAYFGVRAKPLLTGLLTGNQAWCEWMLAGSPQPMPDEVWSVGVDPTETERGGFPAHLVIEFEAEDQRWLLDLDAGFYARPERGIHVPPTVLTPLDQQRPDGPLAGADLEGGGAILYGPCLPRYDFRKTKAWRETKKWTGPVIRRMRDRLKEEE